MKNLLFVFFVCLLCSCANSENKTGDVDPNEIINSNLKNGDAKGDNKCLLAYSDKYDALLSDSDVIAATGFTGKKPETKYNKVLSNTEYHEFLYKFNNGRKGKVLGYSKEMELQDVVAVRSIKSMSVSTFNQSYKAVTDEEEQQANNAINDIVDGKSGNADAEKAMQKAKEQNISNDQIKKTGGAITGSIKQISKGYRKVEGLGDAAVWNVVSNELIVLQNGVKFEIRTDVSNDNQTNKTVAIKLAELILNKCK